jgi:hypothetical protein
VWQASNRVNETPMSDWEIVKKSPTLVVRERRLYQIYSGKLPWCNKDFSWLGQWLQVWAKSPSPGYRSSGSWLFPLSNFSLGSSPRMSQTCCCFSGGPYLCLWSPLYPPNISIKNTREIKIQFLVDPNYNHFSMVSKVILPLCPKWRWNHHYQCHWRCKPPPLYASRSPGHPTANNKR